MKKFYTILSMLVVLIVSQSISMKANFPQKYQVFANNSNPVLSFNSVLGKKYLIKVKGTYSLWPEYDSIGADGICVYQVPSKQLTSGMWPPLQISQRPPNIRPDILYFTDTTLYFPREVMSTWPNDMRYVKVRINPFEHIGFRFDNKPIPINPIKYNSSNTYEFEYTGTGKPFEMVIRDSYYSIIAERDVSNYSDNSGRIEVEIDTLKPIVPCSGPEWLKINDTTYVVKLGLSVNELISPNTYRANKELSNKLAIYEGGQFKCPLIVCDKDSISQDFLSISLLIDQSGSMKWPIDTFLASTIRIEAARKAANTFIDGLGPTDEVMLHTFNTVLNKQINWTNDKSAVKSKINAIIPDGGTNMESSLISLLNQVELHPSPKKYIILLSDGEDTDPFTSINDVLTKIDQNKQSGSPVPIFTIALGLNNVEALNNLKEIADRSNGKHFSANNADSLSLIYSKIYNIIDSSRCCEFTYKLEPCTVSEKGKEVTRTITIMHPMKGVVSTKELTYKLDCRGANSVDEEYVYNSQDQLRVSELSPNPTGSSSSIAYDVNMYSKVAINLFDISGNLVKRYFSGFQDTGHYRMSLDMSDLESGSYNLIVQMNDNKVSRKLIISK